MINTQEFGRYLTVGEVVDFSGLYAGILKYKPKCPDCGVPLQESETGVRARVSDDGEVQHVCRPCALEEIAERLLVDMPQ